MAKMKVHSSDELILQLERIGNIDAYAPKILEAGIQPLHKKIKENAQKHRRTGEMAASAKTKKPKKNKLGVWSQSVQFDGYDKSRKPTPSDPRGVPNARKAMSLEYGTSKQPATPFIRPAVIQTENECVRQMQETFNKEIAPLKLEG
jgi:HK97 gp10 family phage protein